GIRDCHVTGVQTCALPIYEMATITKRELVIRITDHLGTKGIEITQQDVLEVVQTLIDEITESLALGDTVVMRNFGAFQVREMKRSEERRVGKEGRAGWALD